jgi:chromate transporter
MREPSLSRLFLMFALFSIMAVGGANATVPEIHRQVVELHGWMTSAEFAGLFAIAQASPGPNMLIVSLIGWKLAGLPGALVCTLGMGLPSSLLTFTVARLWHRFGASPWRRAIQRGLAPITIGLVLGGGWMLCGAAGSSWRSYALSAAVAALTLKTRLHPLWLLACGGLLGLVGWLG